MIALVKPPAFARVGKAAVLLRAHVLRALFLFAALGLVLAEHGGDDDDGKDHQDLYGVSHRRLEWSGGAMCSSIVQSQEARSESSGELNAKCP